MKAVVLQREALVNKRISRMWRSAGLEVVSLSDPSEVQKHLEGAALLGADEFDRDVVVSALREHPNLRACVWMAEPINRVLRVMKQEPRLSSVLGRANFETTPREWELLLVAQRAASPLKRVPFSAYLRWGFSGFEIAVRDTNALELAVAKTEKFIASLDVPKWITDALSELTHELLMNAVYDAPADSSGRPKFAHDRKQRVELPPEEAATLRVGCDGVLVCIQVVDPFGRLQREHVVDGLLRGLQTGELDEKGGGAGLGMAVCHNSTVAMIYDIIPGRQTEVTGFFDLDVNRRDFRTAAKSLHYFQHDAIRK
jgi:hypothetical protein